MRTLILGGTEFAGRHLAQQALDRGHHVTVLNRGHNPPPPGVDARTGDRTRPDALAALGTDTYDIVIDTWSWAPSAVRDAARTLSGRAGHYTYISSRSVYTDDFTPPLTETSPTVPADPDAEADNDYAAAKRGAELAAEREFAGPVLHARAGLILGPDENIGRLPWWLTRLHTGGPTLAPGPQDLPLQLIDVRDLATFVLDAAAAGLTGAYNTVSAPGHTTMGELLEIATEVTGSRAELRWTDPQIILDAGIQPWTELPIWLPPGPDHDYIHSGDVSKVLAAGLRTRPVRETVADTWAWMQTLTGTPAGRAGRSPVGLAPGKEAAVLEKANL
ncbi:NAD-dependent epimerase/dehydratase family protein [Actinoplanes sp. N902-109]|uniref:NAD-dependent epimerase/dehydratase family protein n=1 Tax=Actinoplanes sp. (strain N902-109) TaxID=649831 RepID=UPI0003294981|nr:NAD-dependent epimerase/dehydratase family protein [Actinoplanes sp. N902-109]AGL17503.1 putative reductase [Actinoplanes sp. N902-109]